MQGVEILTSTEVLIVNNSAFWWTFFPILAICIAAGLMVAANEDNLWWITGGALCGFILGILIGGFPGGLWGNDLNYETQHKVTISEEVSLTEFFKRYEIIDWDGKLYTIKEK